MNPREIDPNSPATYAEVQSLAWGWKVYLLILAATTWFALVSDVLFHRPWGNHPAPTGMMIAIWLVFGIGLPWLLFSARLKVTVDSTGVNVRLFPFLNRTIEFEQIQSWSVVRFRPIWDFGGWGLRYSLARGWAYTIRGNQGIRLNLLNSGPLTIGTRKPEALARALEQAVRKSSRPA